MVKPISTMWRC